MKSKTVSKIIDKKITAWLASIEDELLRARLQHGVIVTGGAIASMLLGERVKDFDVYFRTSELAEAVAKYYVARFEVKTEAGIPCNITVTNVAGRIGIKIQSAGVASEAGTEKPYEYFEASADGAAGDYVADVMDEGTVTGLANNQEKLEELQERTAQSAEETGKALYRPVFMSTNAITLSDRVQCVLRFTGEPEEIHKNYDFVHCTNYWCSWDKKLVLHEAAVTALLTRELRYVGSLYPLASLLRIRKFLARGFTVNAGQIVKICMQLNALELTNFEVLREQLTGVDVAYFGEVLAKLHAEDPTKINTAYLIEIIDRMF